MAKKTVDARLDEALTTIAGVTPDGANFMRYCLTDGKYSSMAAGKGADAGHDLTSGTTRTAISEGMSLGEHKLGAAAKRKRNLRRAIMLLHSNATTVRTTNLAADTVAPVIRALDEQALQNYLLASWRGTMVAEAFDFLRKNYDAEVKVPILSQIHASRSQQHRTDLETALGDGLFGGDTADEFHLAAFRGALLLIEMLSRTDTTTLAALKTTVSGMDLTGLKAEYMLRRASLTTTRMAFVDALPDNVEGKRLLLDMRARRLEFFKTTSVHTMDGSIPVTSGEFTLAAMPSNRPMDLGFVRRDEAEIGAVDLQEVESTTRTVPLYFLPWRSHYVTKMTIPAGGPDVFFTAAINGCSVFVTGTARAPTVYHAGIGAPLATSYKHGAATLLQAAAAGDSALFWRRLLVHLEGIKEADILGEVNRNHYVLDTVSNTKSIIHPSSVTTPHAAAFEANLATTMPGANVVRIAPWGCVFGLRTGTDWTFYLQENVSMTYTRAAGGVFDTCRPIFLSKVFPVTTRAVNEAVWDGTNIATTDLFTPSLRVRKK